MKQLTKAVAREINEKTFGAYLDKEVQVSFGNYTFNGVKFIKFDTYRVSDLQVSLEKRTNEDGKQYSPKLAALCFAEGNIIFPYEDITITTLVGKIVIEVEGVTTISLELQ